MDGMTSTVTRTKTYAVCPTCGADMGCVDHLLGQRTSTWWYCEACGQRARLEFRGDGGTIVTPDLGRKVKTVDVLMLPPQRDPVYFVVTGMRFEGADRGSDTDEHEHKRFFYESHSCPTNWLKPTTVYHDGNDDPHGLLLFVATKDESAFPLDEPYGPNDRDAAIVRFIEEHDQDRQAL